MSVRARDSGPDAIADDFWRYSARLFGRPGVSEKCLQLQDEAGVDVNVMLFCCWTAFRASRGLSREAILGLLAATEDWREGAIKPIRRLRRELKDLIGTTEGSGFVYDAIKRCELDAEKVKQQLLIKAAGSLEITEGRISEAAQIAHDNILNYFDAVAIEDGNWMETNVAAIIAAAGLMENAVSD